MLVRWHKVEEILRWLCAAHQEENAFGLVEGAVACTGIVGGLLGEKLQHELWSNLFTNFLLWYVVYVVDLCPYLSLDQLHQMRATSKGHLTKLKSNQDWLKTLSGQHENLIILLRGCPHITSANFGGFQTPPPPLVSNRQQLPDPPSPPRQHSSAFAWPPLPPLSGFVSIWPTPPP